MKLSKSLSFGALVALLFAASSSRASSSDGDYDHRDDLTEAVIACEEAYTRLENCCPGYSAYVGFDERRSPCLDLEWRHTSGGCTGPSTVNTGNTEPLAIHESECILGMTCDDLVTSGVCDRAENDPTISNERGRAATRRICP